MNSPSNSLRTWSPTKNGLRRYLRPGARHNVWYINCRIRGTVINECTGTTSKAAARRKLFARLAEPEAAVDQRIKIATGSKLTLGDCARILQHRYDASALDELTKAKRRSCLATLSQTWSEVSELRVEGLGVFETCRPSQLSYDHLLFWREYFVGRKEEGGAGYSADYFNKLLKIVRDVFQIAVEAQQIARNPAERVARAPIKKTDRRIPHPEEIQAILDHPSLTPAARDFLDGLRFTGLRKDEANNLRARHVDLINWQIHLPADICKNGQRGRSIPIFAEARPLFKRLVAEADGPDTPLFKVKSARRQFKAAAEKVGLGHYDVDHHILRHCFATRCLECTKDVQVVAAWLGHSDKGKLCLETYAHVCSRFSNQAAILVRFGAL